MQRAPRPGRFAPAPGPGSPSLRRCRTRAGEPAVPRHLLRLRVSRPDRRRAQMCAWEERPRRAGDPWAPLHGRCPHRTQHRIHPHPLDRWRMTPGRSCAAGALRKARAQAAARGSESVARARPRRDPCLACRYCACPHCAYLRSADRHLEIRRHLARQPGSQVRNIALRVSSREGRHQPAGGRRSRFRPARPSPRR